MNRLERLYAVNEAIRRASPDPVSAQMLADRFEVSRRTIERDIESLRRSGMPLYAEAGRHGGQRSLENPRHVMLSLSVAEVTALTMALAASGPDVPYGEMGRSAVERIIETLPDETRVGVQDLRRRVRTSTDHVDQQLETSLRRILEQGVQRRCVININYTDSEGTETHRAVEPAGFLQRDATWFLAGWCRLRNDRRLFRFDRIERARLTKQQIEERELDEMLGWLPYETTAP